MDFESDNIIKFLIDMGILIPLGFDEEIGQDMYLLSDDAKTFMPEVSEEHQMELNAAVFDLWNIDMLNVVFDDDGEPLIGLNENSLDKSKVEAIENEELKRAMIGILAAFADRFG